MKCKDRQRQTCDFPYCDNKNCHTEIWVNAILQNDELATTVELINFFQREGGFSLDQSVRILNHRETAQKDRNFHLSLKEIL